MKHNKARGGALGFLYGTVIGRLLLRLLTARFLSKAVGAFLDSRFSKPIIKPFVKSNGIELDDYLNTDSFRCFNDCFTRQINPRLRPIDEAPSALISPCDGAVSAYRITDTTVFPVKQSSYTLASLLQSSELAERFKNGTCVVIRLAVDNYHRYCYADCGVKEPSVFIKGILHTVRPIALEHTSVFTENCREYTLLHTHNFGDIIQIEVGAMLVGRIRNNNSTDSCSVKRGEEKGRFEYGGSTVILLLGENSAVLDPKYFDATAEGRELPVKMGEAIGHSVK